VHLLRDVFKDSFREVQEFKDLEARALSIRSAEGTVMRRLVTA